jgi:hypothetical protein
MKLHDVSESWFTFLVNDLQPIASGPAIALKGAGADTNK